MTDTVHIYRIVDNVELDRDWFKNSFGSSGRWWFLFREGGIVSLSRGGQRKTDNKLNRERKKKRKKMGEEEKEEEGGRREREEK